jgi:hypothetical protein
MKHLILAILILSSIGTVSVPASAGDDPCKVLSLAVIVAASKLADTAVDISNERKTAAIAYNAAAGGPGPGRFAQAAFMQSLEQRISAQNATTARMKAAFDQILKQNPQCFPSN